MSDDNKTRHPNYPGWMFIVLRHMGREPVLSAVNLYHLRVFWREQMGRDMPHAEAVWRRAIILAWQGGPLT